ncbi:MAG TPA: GNAT family N-acetyltransferase [Gammaproteobacteria bacterium]
MPIRNAPALPRLETRRLVIRVPMPDDAEALAAFVTENRAHFARWDPQRDETYFTVAGCRGRLEIMLQEAAAGRSLPFVLVRKDDPSGAIIGQCTFSGITGYPFHAAFLGYGLDHRFVGQGLMTEALEAAIGYCFRTLNLHRIMANHLPTNVRSANLLRRLGFVPEGYARDYLLIAGRWQDHVLTALTNPDWRRG